MAGPDTAELAGVRKMTALPVATIGYEGRSLDEFLRVLVDNDIELLVDVRLTPMSRKQGFSKRILASALAERGISYEHVPELGNPKENRAGFRTAEVDIAKQRYLAHLNNGSRSAYERVLSWSDSARVALLCFEADEQQCHRGCISAQAQQERPGLRVDHL